MGIRLYKEPRLEKPDMIVGWPGIGNIGIIAVDTKRGRKCYIREDLPLFNLFSYLFRLII